MAQDKKAKAGSDDIARGDFGTGDQNSGDVSSHGKVNASTGKIPVGAAKGGKREPKPARR